MSSTGRRSLSASPTLSLASVNAAINNLAIDPNISHPDSEGSSNTDQNQTASVILVSRSSSPNLPLEFSADLEGEPLDVDLDLRAVTYIGEVDENLICTICRCPFVDPVMTECHHIFCRSCLEECFRHYLQDSHVLTCPLDRTRVQNQSFTLKNRAPNIVRNQLDGLKVKCGKCSSIVTRSFLGFHLAKQCIEVLVRCPGFEEEKKCLKKVKRKFWLRGCLHYDAECVHCQEQLQDADMDDHLESTCTMRHKECELCQVEILRVRESEHLLKCPKAVVSCKWAQIGCKYVATREAMVDHTANCSLNSLGAMILGMKEQISDLQSEVRDLKQANVVTERRLKIYERGERDLFTNDLGEGPVLEAYSDYMRFNDELDGFQQPNVPGDAPYVMTQMEMGNHIERMQRNMTDLDIKHTNFALAVKNDLDDLRSMGQTTSMHIRWLMQLRQQEMRNRVGSLSRPHRGNSDGENDATSLPRRLSDLASRDLVTKL